MRRQERSERKRWHFRMEVEIVVRMGTWSEVGLGREVRVVFGKEVLKALLCRTLSKRARLGVSLMLLRVERQLRRGSS